MIYAFGEFEFDEERWELRSGTSVLDVPPKVMDLLALLLQQRDRFVPTEELLARLWPRVTVTDASITKSIRIARQILGDDGDTQRFIKTIRGRGYRFVAPVRDAKPSLPPAANLVPPAPSRSVDEPPFVGRASELRELCVAVDRAFEGRGSFFLLSGDPGIGKTRLVEACASYAVAGGGSVHWGRCSEEGGAPELWPWLQVVRELLEAGDCSLDEMAVLEALVKASTEPSVPAEAVSWTPLSTESARFRVFDAIASALKRSALRKPVLVALEDLQSADASTLMLTRFVARELRDARIVVIATYRPAELGMSRAKRLFGKLVQDARTIELGGLPEADLARLATAILGAPPDQELEDRLRRTTDGNPLFATEVLRLIAATPFENRNPSRAWKMPDRVIEAVRGRFDALAASTRDVLAVASVIGRDFDVRVLLEASELDAPDLARELDTAEDRRLVTPLADSLGSYRFCHGLLREVLYDDLPASRRAALHLRIGQILERAAMPGTEPAAAQLAHHFLRAALGGASEKAAVHCMAAGRHAMAAFAFDEAAEHFQHALDALRFLNGKELLRCDALVGLGNAYSSQGNYAAARDTFRQAFEAALKHDDRLRAARAALGYAQVKPESGIRNDEVIALLERIVPILEASPRGPESTEALALSLARLAICLPFANRMREAEELGRRALGLARSMRPEILALCLLARHWVLWKPGTARERLAIASEILGLTYAISHHQSLMEARLCQITDLLELGRADELAIAIAEYDRLAQSSRDPLALWNTRVFETMRNMLEGRFADAERLAFETLPEVLRIDEQNARMFFVAQIWWIRLEQGRASEIVQLSREAVESHTSDPLFRAAALRVYIAEGDREAATDQLDVLARNDFGDLTEGFQLLPMLAHAAAACEYLGDAEVARVLSKRLTAYEGTHVVIGPAIVYIGPVSYYLGLCARAQSQYDEAIRRFQQALIESRALRARPMQARAQYHLAEALFRRRADSDAVSALAAAQEALSIARQLGMQELERRATALLADARVDASSAGR